MKIRNLNVRNISHKYEKNVCVLKLLLWRQTAHKKGLGRGGNYYSSHCNE